MEHCYGVQFSIQVTSTGSNRNKSVCNLCNAMYNAHTGPLFKQLRIPKLVDIYNSHLCKRMYLFTSGTLPCPLHMVFTRNSDVHSYPTRIAHDPHFVARKKSLLLKILYVPSTRRLVQIVSTKSCKTIKTFNYHVKRYFINAY